MDDLVLSRCFFFPVIHGEVEVEKRFSDDGGEKIFHVCQEFGTGPIPLFPLALFVIQMVFSSPS